MAKLNPEFDDLPRTTQYELGRAGYEVLTMMAEAPNWDGAADWLDDIYVTLKLAYPDLRSAPADPF